MEPILAQQGKYLTAKCIDFGGTRAFVATCNISHGLVLR